MLIMLYTVWVILGDVCVCVPFCVILCGENSLTMLDSKSWYHGRPFCDVQVECLGALRRDETSFRIFSYTVLAAGRSHRDVKTTCPCVLLLLHGFATRLGTNHIHSYTL